MGVITGDMLVNGKPLDSSFQRKTGYVQQQDLHMATATVRESLRFSAMLRQPKSVSKKEKYDYVEDVIKMLNMEDFAEAVVGVPGEGLNVEQRKLLTIGVGKSQLDRLSTTCHILTLSRTGCQTQAVTFPRRAHQWLGLAEFLGYLRIPAQACRQWTGRPVYHSPTFSYPVPTV
jgi:hypothetical protein